MEQALQDLVAANRILVSQGVIDAYGHVSIRHPQDPGRYILARAIAPETVQVEDLIEYDLDSKPLNEAGRESVRERYIHGEVYKTRPEVMAIVHNHSPTVVPFSVTNVGIKPLFHMAGFIGEEPLPNFEIRDFQKGTDLLVKTPQLGKALAGVLGARPAALMRGHGAVVVGQTLRHAVGRSIYLEVNARMQLQAMFLAGAGGKIAWIDEAESQACMLVQNYNRAWPMWRDKVLDDAKKERK